MTNKKAKAIVLRVGESFALGLRLLPKETSPIHVFQIGRVQFGLRTTPKTRKQIYTHKKHSKKQKPEIV